MTQPHLEFDNVEAMVTKKVAPGGRLTGLGEYVGMTVRILVLPTDQPKRKRGRKHE